MNIKKPRFWRKKNNFLSLLLFPIAILIQLLNIIKNKFSSNQSFNIPVICVGNIFIGGTGKTPLTIMITKELIEKGKKPAIIRKFYSDHLDEHRLIKNNVNCLFLNKKRNIAIKDAEKAKYDVAILDDGFQDHSIKKNLNILCFNSNQQIGNGQVLPAGPLRETLSSLRSANIIMINGEKNIEFELKLKKYNSNLKFFYFNYNLKKFDEFKNRKLIAFAGIGNSINFFNTLKNNRLNVIREISFPDHYDFTDKDLERLGIMEDQNKAKLITTEKDYLRINQIFRKKYNSIHIDVVLENDDLFKKEINKFLK